MTTPLTTDEPPEGLKLEIIVWDDPAKVSNALNWMTKDDFIEFVTVQHLTVTVGFIIYEDDHIIGMVQSVGQDLVDGGFRLFKQNIVQRIPVGVYPDFSINLPGNEPRWDGVEVEGV